MLSKIPIDLSKVTAKTIDRELLRAGMIAEMDAINLYEQLAALTSDPKLKAVLADVTKEEKTHFGEFQVLLLELDKEQVSEMEHGLKEVKELQEQKGG